MRNCFETKRAIVFDFDGVLLESTSVKKWAFGELYKKYGKQVQEKVIEYQKNNGGINRIEKFKYFHKNFLNQELLDSDIRRLSDEFRELTISELKKSKISPFAIDVLLILKKRGFLLYCVSASPLKELIEILEYKDISHFFTKVYGGSKSKEDNFELLSCDEKINFSDMVYIGDSEIDLTSSVRKNIDFIGYGKIVPKWGKGQNWIYNWKKIAGYCE